MKKKKLALILCFFMLLSGCSRKKQTIPHQVVSHANILCTQGDQTYQLTYRHPKKLEAILNFLRTLRYHGRPETSPEQLSGDRFDIRLTMPDGTVRTHRLQDYAYFCRSGGQWEKIDPIQGRSFVVLLKLMPED